MKRKKTEAEDKLHMETWTLVARFEQDGTVIVSGLHEILGEGLNMLAEWLKHNPTFLLHPAHGQVRLFMLRTAHYKQAKRAAWN